MPQPCETELATLAAANNVLYETSLSLLQSQQALGVAQNNYTNTLNLYNAAMIAQQAAFMAYENCVNNDPNNPGSKRPKRERAVT